MIQKPWAHSIDYGDTVNSMGLVWNRIGGWPHAQTRDLRTETGEKGN